MTDNQRYIENVLLNTKRPNIEKLLKYMSENGFYEMPASGSGDKHLAEKGGLAQHSILVTDTMFKLKDSLNVDIKEDSIYICGLLHDLGKIGQFGKAGYVENILASGKQSESKPYKCNKELLKVPHEIRSVMEVYRYIELTEEEAHAILYHNGLYGDLKYQISGNETSLYLLLHFADMWSSRILERVE